MKNNSQDQLPDNLPLLAYRNIKSFNICFDYGAINNGDDLQPNNTPVYITPIEYSKEYPYCFVIGDDKVNNKLLKTFIHMVYEGKNDFDVLNIKITGHDGNKNNRFCFTALTEELLKNILETFIDEDNKKIVVFENATCESYDIYGKNHESFSKKTIPNILNGLKNKPLFCYYGNVGKESSMGNALYFTEYKKEHNGNFSLSGKWIWYNQFIEDVKSKLQDIEKKQADYLIDNFFQNNNFKDNQYREQFNKIFSEQNFGKDFWRKIDEVNKNKQQKDQKICDKKVKKSLQNTIQNKYLIEK